MDKKRVLIVGTFDLLSISDMRTLESLKSNASFYIIAGVYDDEAVTVNNILTVMTGYERSENLKHTRFIDELLYPCPYILTKQFLELHHIETVFASKYDERFSEVATVFNELPEPSGTSANQIIARVLNEFDEYCERSLGRGYSYSEIGLKELEAKCMFLRLGSHKLKNKALS